MIFAPILALLVQDGIDAKLDQPALKGAVVSACVQTLDGRFVYERNSATRVMPASNQKLLSVGYAYAKLGPDYMSVTRFWKEGPKLVIDAPGNPVLKYDQLKAIRAKFGTSKVIAVKQAYRVGVPGGWELDDLPNRYAAQVSALTVETGSFELWGENGKAFYLPEAFGSTVITFDGPALKVAYDPFRRHAKVFGPIPKVRTRLDTLAIHEPDRAVAGFFGGYLTEAKELPSRPADATIESPPLKEMANECLVKSDNNIAENLMLMAAASEGPLSADPYKTANERMKKFYVEVVGCEKDDLRPQDGSGMSRHSFVTARALAKVMAWQANKWGEDWLKLLAIPGKGTLESRLAGSSFRGKTGTLDSACSLTGTLTSKSGEKLAISLVFNHYLATNAQVRGIQDEIVRMLETSGFGTVLEGSGGDHAILVSHPRSGFVCYDWPRRPRNHRLAAFARTDRRTESDHALAHRAE